MSLITTTNVRRDQIAFTEDVVRRHLATGFASVVEPWNTRDRFVTWSIGPNDPATGLSFGIRDYNRDQLELGARVCNAMGGILQ